MGLWLRFQSACRLAHRIVKPRFQNGFNIKGDGKKIEIDSLIYFQGWPYRAAQTNKIVDILLRSSEKYSSSTNEMTKSTVQVVYLNGKNARHLLALHYDFDSQPQPAHPIFHAQMGSTNFSTEELKSVGFQKSLEKSATPLYGGVRIPTPCMNLGAALLMLAADHLPASEFKNFLADIRINEMIKWNATSDVKDSLTKYGGYLHSHHWYC